MAINNKEIITKQAQKMKKISRLTNAKPKSHIDV